MGFRKPIQAQFERLADRFWEIDEVLSHFTGNLTDVIKAENHRGKQIAEAYFERHPPLLNTPRLDFVSKVHAHLITAAGHLHKDFGNPERTWNITIVDTENMLGCCLPGGYVILDRTIIDFAKTDQASDQAKLAFILAHESAHLLLAHTTKRLSRELGKRAGISLFTPGTIVAALAGAVGYEIAMKMVEGSYSKTEEFEADRLAVHILMRSGIDARGGIDLFRKLQRKYPDIGGFSFPGYFSSHPPIPKRIEKMVKHIQEIESGRKKDRH